MFWGFSPKRTLLLSFKKLFSVCAHVYMDAWSSLKEDAECPNHSPHHSLERVSHIHTGVCHFGARLVVSRLQRFSVSIFNSNTVLGLKACPDTLNCFIWVGRWLSEYEHLVRPFYKYLKVFHLFAFFKFLSCKSLVYLKFGCFVFFFSYRMGNRGQAAYKIWNITMEHLSIIMLINLIFKKIEISWLDHTYCTPITTFYNTNLSNWNNHCLKDSIF